MYRLYYAILKQAMEKKDVFTRAVRGLIVLSTATAAIVVSVCHFRVTTENLTIEANFKQWTAISYFMVVNCIASGYSFPLIFLPKGSGLWKLVAVLDLIISILMATAGASCAVIVNVIKNGTPISALLGCPPYDHFFPNFSTYVVSALSVSLFGIFLQFVICIYTFSVVINPLLLENSD